MPRRGVSAAVTLPDHLRRQVERFLAGRLDLSSLQAWCAQQAGEECPEMHKVWHLAILWGECREKRHLREEMRAAVGLREVGQSG